MPRQRRPARPAISVVVPTRDKGPRLRVTLACLAVQAPPVEAEVVAVDDGSTDATGDVLEEARRHLPLVTVPGGGRGRAAARNLGAARASGAYLVFLDDDVVVAPGFLRAHLRRARPDRFVHGRLRELPAAGRLLRDVGEAPYDRLQRLRDAVHRQDGTDPRLRLVANALERAVEGMHAGRLPDVAPWLGAVGANLGMAAGVWRRAGGFDEGFGRTWGCEDLEFGFRLHAAGVRRALAPAAMGVHLTHGRPQRWEEHERNMRRFASLHPVPAVRALPALLAAGGDPSRYVDQVAAATREAAGASR